MSIAIPPGTAVSLPLTRGFSALVDLEDYDRAAQYKRCVSWNGYTHCVAKGAGGKCVYPHRFLIRAGPDQRIDHINGNGLECRRANMRLCTTPQNNSNSLRASQGCHSRFKGVDRHQSGAWRAKIKIHGVVIHLGQYTDEAEAVHAYYTAARKLHGGFARLNFLEVVRWHQPATSSVPARSSPRMATANSSRTSSWESTRWSMGGRQSARRAQKSGGGRR